MRITEALTVDPLSLVITELQRSYISLEHPIYLEPKQTPVMMYLKFVEDCSFIGEISTKRSSKSQTLKSRAVQISQTM